MIKKIENNKKKFNKPVIPKDASSLIILKKEKDLVKVLMGRRPKSSRFMPNVYVFPGGRIEKIDYSIKTESLMHKSISKEKLKAKSLNHARALVMASIRETAEETGLLLAKHSKIKVNKNE